MLPARVGDAIKRTTTCVTVNLGQSANLNNYTAAACLEDSAVIVGTNRVKWYGIVETRFYDQKGELISRDTLPRVSFNGINISHTTT